MAQFDEGAVRGEAQKLILDVLTRKKVKVKPEDIREGVSLSTQVGIDSLDILQIMATVEKKFKVKIPEEELRRMDDLAGILKTVEKYWPKEA